MSGQEYIVIVPSLVGSGPWETVYRSDMRRHRTRDLAISHGWRVEGHDDFLLGILDGTTLLGLAWQHEDRGTDVYDLQERVDCAEHLGLTPALFTPDPEPEDPR